jgi:hypothetical protein
MYFKYFLKQENEENENSVYSFGFHLSIGIETNNNQFIPQKLNINNENIINIWTSSKNLSKNLRYNEIIVHEMK